MTESDLKGGTLVKSYRSPLREAQAQATRDRILGSARELFTAAGYRATSVSAVADHAGVSDRLLYNVFGSKRDLLMALLDDFAPTPRSQHEAMLKEAAPAEQIGLLLDFTTGYYDVAADLIRVAMGAAGSEPDLAAFVERGESFRRSAQRPLVEQWGLRRVLAQGASVDEAADLMWTMTGPEVYLKLRSAGWTAPRIRASITRLLVRALLT